MPAKRPQPAFTLIELMVVIAIIGVLVAALFNIPWNNIVRYTRVSAIQQISSAVSSARMTALDRGRRAAVIFTQTQGTDLATMNLVLETDTPNLWYNVDGSAPVQLPRGTTVRAPDPNKMGASGYQTNTGGTGVQDNLVDNSIGGAPHVKCFAIAFDSDGRLLTNGSIGWLDGNRDGVSGPVAKLQPSDLMNVPFSPYAAVIDTRSLSDANVLAFTTNNQSAEDAFILNTANPAKFITFNRYSGSALKP